METIKELLGSHPFFAGLSPNTVELIAGCASNVHFAEGDRIFEEGKPASLFYVIRHGRVALQVYSPRRGLWSLTPWTKERYSAGRGSSRPTSTSLTPGR